MSAQAVSLSVDPAKHGDLVTATVDMSAGGEPMTLSLTVPAGEASVEVLLPVLQGLTGLFVQRGVADVEREGKTISCRAGCGACCRQMVPIAGAEARHLARLVDAMPESRQATVRARFAAALALLDEEALLNTLRDTDSIVLRNHGMRYFRLGIPCPFLEHESCSIHPDRPLACREYLVTSPAENCAATADRKQIDRVPLDWDVSRSVTKVPASEGWLPLILTLEFAQRALDGPRQTGPEILSAVFQAPRADPL